MNDAPGPKQTAQKLLADAALCWVFLTRLPLPRWVSLEPQKLSGAMWAFPVVGLVLGLLSGSVLAALAGMGMPTFVSAGIALGTLALLTGGLHEDGLADTADGVGANGSRQRKLEIMRDSRIGTYGVLALVIAIVVKVGALAEIAHGSWPQIAAITAASAALSRGLVVWLIYSTPPARSDGLSAGAGQPPANTLVQAAAIATGAFLLLAGSASGFFAALISFVLAALMVAALRTLAIRQIGGQTGDVCGAAQCLSEMVILVVLSTTFR